MLNYAPIYLATYHYAQNYAGTIYQAYPPLLPSLLPIPIAPSSPPYPSLALVPGSLIKIGTEATPSLHLSLLNLHCEYI